MTTDLDRAADLAIADLLRLAAVWRDGGDAALDAMVRVDPALTFAALDAREHGGVQRLIAARLSETPALVLSFVFGGPRLVVLRGEGCVLRARAGLDDVIVGPRDLPLAEELAWRLSIGVDETARLPEAFDAAPGGFRHRTAEFTDLALLRALATARRLLDGEQSFVDGAREIHVALGEAGIEPTPHALYAIQDDAWEIGAGARERREQALAALEAWSRVHGRTDCEALLARWQSFAEAHG